MSCIFSPLSLSYSPCIFPKSSFKSHSKSKLRIHCAVGESVAVPKIVGISEPLLLHAVHGEKVERPPVWLMRQAGRYMKSYQIICEKHPSFRERSENVDLIVEISLQPWKVFRPDGVILFSDILTPLSGMNIPFNIIKGKGPVIYNPIRSAADVDQVREFVPEESVPYVGEALNILRAEVNNEAAVLGFVGAPFTLASYVVEGGSSKHFTKIKTLAFSQPKVLHALLQKFTSSMTEYIRYQADNGAQAVQIFDSWATELSPEDFEEFSLPYLKQIVDSVKRTHRDLPLILYASGSGGLLERLPLTGVDVVSLDWTVDMAEGRRRLGSHVAVQGNIDPGALFGSKEFISKKIHDTVKKAGNSKHILNLGHGIVVGTPEENVAHFFEVAKGIRY
ncbi:uroporphyrinogen decarboxylase [Tasmannia lanceolata]|uniref:uroporphyrinogen decarboxylase n=1 Tax=Tasmannia lanceolata TaxID=3420 RepID=UPI0040638B93